MTESVTLTLRSLRELAGLTQDQFAARLGTNRITVSRWENGGHIPNSRWIPEMAELLEVSERVLLRALRGVAA